MFKGIIRIKDFLNNALEKNLEFRSYCKRKKVKFNSFKYDYQDIFNKVSWMEFQVANSVFNSEPTFRDLPIGNANLGPGEGFGSFLKGIFNPLTKMLYSKNKSVNRYVELLHESISRECFKSSTGCPFEKESPPERFDFFINPVGNSFVKLFAARIKFQFKMLHDSILRANMEVFSQ